MEHLVSPKLDSGLSQPNHAKWLLIIISNLVPLLGVFFWSWDLAHVVLLYWFENLVIGFWTLAKMLTAKNLDEQSGRGSLGGRLFMCGFFTFHYGMFCLCHAAFILKILGMGDAKDFFPFATMIKHQVFTPALLMGIAVTFVTHGIDFVQNFYKTKKREELTAHILLFSPYGHIIVIHLAILFGAAIVMNSGQPIGLLLLIVLGKTILEFITLAVSNKISNN